MSSSGISWAICKSASRSRQITMPAPYHSVFLPARCPSCHPTNSVKALKASSKKSQATADTKTMRITQQCSNKQWTQKPLRRQARRHQRTTMSIRLLPRSRDWSRVSDPRECGKNRIRLSRSSSSSRLTRLTTHKTHYFNLDAQNQSKCQVRCGPR